MSLDTTALFAEAKALGMYEEPKPRKRTITKRRYNVLVDGNIVAENCTMQDVKILRTQYREQDKSIEIDEIYACDSNGNDITKLPAPNLPKAGKYSVAEITGIQNFATPTLTDAKAKAQAASRRKEVPLKQNYATRVIENPWRNRNSSLYPEYMKGVTRDGFIVIYKDNGQMLYWGQRKEVIDFLKEFNGDINSIKCIPVNKKNRKKYGF